MFLPDKFSSEQSKSNEEFSCESSRKFSNDHLQTRRLYLKFESEKLPIEAKTDFLRLF